MIRWKFWTIIIIIFITGGLLGSAGTALYIRQVVSGIVRGDSRVLTGFIMGKLSRNLDLTDEQEARADKIVRGGYEQWMDIRRAATPRVEEIIQKTVDELKMILSPDQVEDLDHLVGEAKERWALPAPPGE